MKTQTTYSRPDRGADRAVGAEMWQLVAALAGIAALIALAATVLLGMGVAGAVLGEGGMWPASLSEAPRTIAMVLLHAGDPAAAYPNAGPTAPSAAVAWVAVALFLVPLVMTVTIAVVAVAARRGDRSGLASAKDFVHRAGLEVTPPLAYLGGKAITVKAEDTGLCAGPARGGKTSRIVIRLVLDAPGPVVTTSTRPDVLRRTAMQRSEVGRVHVIDFDEVSRWPELTRWDIVAGCEDPRVAAERAGAMVAAVPLGGAKNVGFFEEAAKRVLAGLMHAAALSGGNMRDVVKWSRDFRSDAPYSILRDHPAAAEGWEADLTKYCRGESPETVSSTDQSLGLILGPVAFSSVLDLLCPPRGTGFDIHSFLLSTDALYLMSEGGEQTSTGPLTTALVASIDQAARRMATSSIEGRLSPRLTYVLDEVANIAVLPRLPSMMSEGGGAGRVTWAFVQSEAQLRDRWGENAGTIVDSAGVYLVLGGLKDESMIRKLSALCGDRWVRRTSTSSGPGGHTTSTRLERERVMAENDIRELPEGFALMIYGRTRPAVVQLPAYWELPNAAEFETALAWCLARESAKGWITA
ncbi:MAG: type IV secretory system conjugative DNA transfer family protein [Janthinobacterium lividum]